MSYPGKVDAMTRPKKLKLGRDQMLELAFDEDGGFLYNAMCNRFGEPVIVDNSSNALAGIDFWNHKIHEGEFFTTNAVDLSMSVGDTITFAFKTPESDVHIHLATDFITNGDAHLDIMQGVDWNQGTGSLTIIRNRLTLSEKEAAVEEDVGQVNFEAHGVLILNPDNLSEGQIIDTTYTFTDVPRGQGGKLGIREWVLSPNTKYAVRLTSDVNNNKGQLKLYWYQHVNVN